MIMIHYDPCYLNTPPTTINECVYTCFLQNRNQHSKPKSPKMQTTFLSTTQTLALKQTLAPKRIRLMPLKATMTHSSMLQEKIEICKSLESWVSQRVLPFLKPVEQSWQPQDFLPDSSLPFNEFNDQVKELRNRTDKLVDEYFVVLVGDMITEEALPTYQMMLNNMEGVRDETGSSQSAWAIWTRSWTAEENRHGDLLRTYLYLSGRVDMVMIERTIQYLIGNGIVSSSSIFLFVCLVSHLHIE